MTMTNSTSTSTLWKIVVFLVLACFGRDISTTQAYVTRSGGHGITEPWSPKLTPYGSADSSSTGTGSGQQQQQKQHRHHQQGQQRQYWQQKSSSSSSSSRTSVVDEVFRDEYETWAQRYDKATSTERFEIFKQNYMLQMQQNKRLGTFHLLNEYGDLTIEEYDEFLETGLLPETMTPISTAASATATATATEPASASAPDAMNESNRKTERQEQEQQDTTSSAVPVEVELVSETEDELRRRHQQERRRPNTAPSATSTTVSSSTTTQYDDRNPKVEPLFTNHDNVARSRGGAVPGSLNDVMSSSSSSFYGQKQSQGGPAFECRHKYTTGGTQFLGVKKRLVRWTPDMPR